MGLKLACVPQALAELRLQTNPSGIEANKAQGKAQEITSYRRTLVGLKRDERDGRGRRDELQTNPSGIEARFVSYRRDTVELLQTNPSGIEATSRPAPLFRTLVTDEP